MKIAKVEQFFPRKRGRLVKITTGNGLVGWGENVRWKGVPRGCMVSSRNWLIIWWAKDPAAH